MSTNVKGRGGRSGTRGRNERNAVTSSSQMPQIQHSNDEGQTSVDPSMDHGPSLISPPIKKNVRGRYRMKEVEKLTRNGELINIDMVVGKSRVIGDKARIIANYLGHVLRTTVSFRDGTWNEIAAKHGPVMFTKMKNRFKPKIGMNEATFEGYCVMPLQKAFRTWKSNLHTHYQGCGPKPPRKTRINETEVDAKVASAMESVRTEMREELHGELRVELREELCGELRSELREDLRAELLVQIQDEMDRRLNAQLNVLMGRLQQVISQSVVQLYFHQQTEAE